MPSSVKIGLEIHIQLKGNKLFCNCSTESEKETGTQFVRKLTARSGESGKFDPAAIYEKSRSRSFSYMVTDNSCLLEADEEPPHELNMDALKKALAASLALNCKVVDEVSYMRKIVIDGSNTSGFQRTGIIGFNGFVETSKGKVGVSTICLEEDSARKISEEKGQVVYSLDRLGVPLLEIATEPDIVDANHAVETAEIIGKKLLLAGWVRRAPDAIRQDVNFSMGFGRVEIKGVPKLSTIRDALSYEQLRQTWISQLSPIIRKNDWSRIHFTDVSEILKNTGSKLISRNLSSGLKVYGTVLPGLEGYLKQGEYKVGRELADVAKLFGSGGIMHSDELPGYGVDQELPELKEILEPKKGDGFMIIASTPSLIVHIESAMVERLAKLASLDLPETRLVSDDGTTHYLRPLPGGERMYPETDVQIIALDEAIMNDAREMAPKPEEDMVKSIVSSYGISSQDAKVILNTGKMESLQVYSDLLKNSRLAARLILQTLPEIEKKYQVSVADETMKPLLAEAGKKGWDRQTIETAAEMLCGIKMPLSKVLENPELNPLDEEELKALITKLISSGEANSKNIIPKLRSATKRTFDPAMAVRIASKLST